MSILGPAYVVAFLYVSIQGIRSDLEDEHSRGWCRALLRTASGGSCLTLQKSRQPLVQRSSLLGFGAGAWLQ